MTEIRITGDQRETFGRDGFVVAGDVLTAAEVEAARARFEPLFAGEFEAGLQPDEWNWRAGLSAKDRAAEKSFNESLLPNTSLNRARALAKSLGGNCERWRIASNAWPGSPVFFALPTNALIFLRSSVASASVIFAHPGSYRQTLVAIFSTSSSVKSGA